MDTLITLAQEPTGQPLRLESVPLQPRPPRGEPRGTDMPATPPSPTAAAARRWGPR